ncbi:hypothetical protein B0A50_02628 [Salinomyces thailandicus]|uniref:Oxidoreductase-like protein n=1 Tax=Salinomyces thailandicus TaxID=706561 RepID=A0A4U0U5H2_9PEZI|nr:hypothetical protein B0A50_02628 [Salinomyces thailandica]
MSYEIESTVEAGSLSTITAIASNPPQHPGLPVPIIGSPLVLYIARVPGSRDVFLTPLKPREKVVSAEDVQSCLYFVHINEEDDEKLLETDGRRSSSGDSQGTVHRSIKDSSVSRKPVLPARPSPPMSPPYPTHDAMPYHLQGPPSPPIPHRLPRKPLYHGLNEWKSHYPGASDLPDIPRRPLPTPPDEQPRRTSLHDDNVRLLRHSGHNDDSNPYFRRYSEDSMASPNGKPDVPKVEPGHLTLIRRDPTSGEQWNVASIHDPPIQEVSSLALLSPSSAMRTKKGGVPLFLDITTPGYLPFIDADRPVSRNSTSTGSSDTEPPPEGTFRRRLYMPGSRYGVHSYGHRRQQSDDSGSDMRRTMRSNTSSDMSNSHAKWDRRSKGYSFKSPWDGQCEFTTGATGRSLKCRHTFGYEGATDLSELRFNLPNSSRVDPAPPTDKRTSIFSRHSRLLSSEDHDADPIPTAINNEDGSVDLSLGQEKAGGGFGGKQAKLGKLIITPEGTKMLDLLVAANIGLWWRAYEKA